MVRVRLLRFLFHVDDLVALFAHGLEQPHHVVGVGVDGVGEVEAAAATLRSGDDEQVREALTVQSKESTGALGLPLLAERTAVAADDHVKRRGRHPLEAGGVDQDVERIFLAVVHDPASIDLADAHRGGVNQVHVGFVERGQVLVVEGRTLAPIGVVGLEGLGGLLVGHDGIDPGADLLHDPEVRLELLLDQLLGREATRMLLALLEVVDDAREVVVVGLDGGTTLGDASKASPPRTGPTLLLLPGLDLFLGRGPLVAGVDGRRRALEDVQLAHHLRQLGNGLHRRCPGADDANPLPGEIDVVVPARRVERVTLEGLHSFDASQLGAGEDAVCQDHRTCPHGVATIGVDGPTAVLLVPLGLVDRGVEEAVVVEAEPFGQRLAVLEDLEPRSELHGREVAHLLQQWEVAVRLDVAGNSRIAVPVPSAADVSPLLAEADVDDAFGLELVPQQQAGDRPRARRTRRSAPHAEPDRWNTRPGGTC